VEKQCFFELLQGQLKSEQFIIIQMSPVLFCFLSESPLQWQYL